MQENAGTDDSKALAFEIAQKWIYQNWASFVDSDVMYEKYNVTQVIRIFLKKISRKNEF